MKQALSIIVLFAFLFITQSQAAVLFPVTSSPLELTVEVNGNPIVIYEPNFNQNPSDIFTLVRGEIHTFSGTSGPNRCPRIGFDMEKDYNRGAIVQMWIPNYPVHGVYLVAHWESAPNEATLVGTPIDGNTYHWDNPGVPGYLVGGVPRAQGQVRLIITQIDAHTTPPLDIELGDAVFEINVSADYY